MKYTIHVCSLLTSTFFMLTFHSTCASISRPSIYQDALDLASPILDPINGTNNFWMRIQNVKDGEAWGKEWKGGKGSYNYCVRESQSKCEELKYTRQCFGQNISYQSTSLELTNYISQQQSLNELISFQAIQYVPKCWQVIQPFLCAVFFPRCETISGVNMVYLPSLEMCKITREPCRILYDSGYFPDFLKCNETNFPKSCKNDAHEMKFNTTGQCLGPLVPINETSKSYPGIEGCGLQCKDPLFTDDEHRLIGKLVGWGFTICFVCCGFAVITFIIDWRNGRNYPAVIIFFINLCFLISCGGLALQFTGLRDEIVCREDNTLRKGEPVNGDNFWCILDFILVYYFLMAATCWFVIFTYAWNMSLKAQANGKNSERINKNAHYFHVIAWSIPTVLTIATVAINEVDGNSTVGICFVGYVNQAYRWGLVLVPLVGGLFIGAYFIFRGMSVLIKLSRSSKQIISARASNKIKRSIWHMGICSVVILICIVVTIGCHVYEFTYFISWAESLKSLIICNITSTYSETYADDDSLSCKLIHRPSITYIRLNLGVLFVSGILMASFVFTSSTLTIWKKFINRKCCGEVEKPTTLPKHKVIAKAFARRNDYKDHKRMSISMVNSHTDPVGIKFEMNSAVGGSFDFSTEWAENLPKFVNRRPAICPAITSDHDRSSIDSQISFSVRHVSVESRRNSNDSQVSVKIAEMKTKVASRSRGSKSKPRSSRHNRRDFTSRRYSRKESSTSMESQIVAMTQKESHLSAATTAELGGGMLVPFGHRRRSGISEFDHDQIKQLIANNKFLLPFSAMMTSEDDKSSIGSVNIQDSKLDMILKQIGLSEQQIIENNFDDENDSVEIKNKSHVDVSSMSSKENLAVAGRSSKNSNKSIASKKSLKTSNSSRLRKTKRSSRSIAKTVNPLSAITNSSSKSKNDKKCEKNKKSKENHSLEIELSPMNGNLQGSYSGRSDVGIQTEMPSETFSSMELVERLRQDRGNDDDDDDQMENHKLLPKKLSLNTATKNRDTLTESEKLKLLLLP